MQFTSSKGLKTACGNKRLSLHPLFLAMVVITNNTLPPNRLIFLWCFFSRKLLLQQEKPPSYALVANKIDLEHLRTIKSDRHHKFAQEHGLLTYAVSAKTGEGVSLCMQKIAADLLGIRLTKQEQEQHGAVMKAEIVKYSQDALPRNPQANANTSGVCSVM